MFVTYVVSVTLCGSVARQTPDTAFQRQHKLEKGGLLKLVRGSKMMNGKVTDDTNTTLTIPDNACVLAPMVRCGTLPLRLFALRRGADLVFTEELVDRPLAESVRLYNERAKTEDFCTKDVAVVLRTKPEEKPKLVLQLGTSNPSLAVQAVNKARHCISAVDINCGCPKHFSIQAGMGAALLRKPETLTELIKSIRTDCKLPVSCKIRLLDTKADTIHLMQQIEQAGASFISVHVRTVAERAKDPAHWDMLGELVKSVNVPVIANGDIWSAEDISSIRKFSGCRGVMLARGALFDPSIFTVHKTGDVRCYTSIEESVQEYLRIAAEVGNMHANTKFTVLSMLKECKSLNAEKGLAVQRYV